MQAVPAKETPSGNDKLLEELKSKQVDGVVTHINSHWGNV